MYRMAARAGRLFALACILMPIGCLAISGVGVGTGKSRARQEPQTIFEGAERIELYSLDGTPAQGGYRSYYGWKVLGKAEVTVWLARQRVILAVQRGVDLSDGSTAAGFTPRHGVRAVRGKERVDMVICYRCGQIRLYNERGEPVGSVPTGRTGEATLDDILRSSGVPLANNASR